MTMEFVDTVPLDVVHEELHFLPRRSVASWLIAFLLGLLALLLVGAAFVLWVSPTPGRNGSAGQLVLLALGLLCAWGVRFFVQRARSRAPVLSLLAHGLATARYPQGIAWDDLEDAQLARVQGNAVLHLQLKPEAQHHYPRAWWQRWSPQHMALNLYMLTPHDVQAAWAAVQQRLTQARVRQGQGEAPSVVQERAAKALAQRLQQITPQPWALYAVLALNVGVWVLNLRAGLSPLQPKPADLFAWGGNSAWAVTQEGQYWRLLTAAFLHAGWLHLALNLFALWESGRQVCRWFGNGQFLLIYLGAALGGSALSLHFAAQQSVAVGASGAVFGVLGALVVAAWKHRERLPGLSRNLYTSQGVLVAYMLAQGFTRPGIDNAAHVGGLLVGAALAAVLIEFLDEQASPARRLRRQWVAALAGLLAVGALVLSAPASGLNHRQFFAAHAEFERWLPQLEAAEKALQKDAQATQAQQMSEAEFVQRIEQQHLPDYRRIEQALARLEFDARDPAQPILKDVQQISRLVSQLLALQLERVRPQANQEVIALQSRTLSEQLQALSLHLQSLSAKPPRHP